MEIKKVTRQQNHAAGAGQLQMVEQFRRSGLTRAAFSRLHGIPLATLNWWLAKTKRDSNLPVPVIFSEVMLPPPSAATTSTWAMEIARPDGLMIRCRETFCVEEIDFIPAKLIRRRTVRPKYACRCGETGIGNRLPASGKR